MRAMQACLSQKDQCGYRINNVSRRTINAAKKWLMLAKKKKEKENEARCTLYMALGARKHYYKMINEEA